MSIFVELKDKLDTLKTKAEGDFHDLVLKLEAVFHHVHASHVEPVVKEAVAAELHHAAIKVDNIVNQVKLVSDETDKAVDEVATVVDTAAKKK